MTGPQDRGAGYDLITVGRVNMDLYSRDIGADFEDITGFDAMVGGSPTNIAIATARLGLRSIAFTGVGEDLVGDFVLRYLRDEQVETAYVKRVPGKMTSLAMLGVKPPSEFPLVFYRQDPADIYLTADDAAVLPFEQTRAVELSGNALSRGPCADATRWIGQRADELGLDVFMDLDLRPVEWAAPKDYGAAIRDVLPHVDVAIGTEEEFYAALMDDPEVVIGGHAVPEDRHGALDDAVAALVASGMEAVALKRGPRGVTIVLPDGNLDVPGFPVEVVNTVGAGDAFAGGLIRSRLLGLDWWEAARFANACGAIEVTRHGCASAFPTEAEIEAFVAERGGW